MNLKAKAYLDKILNYIKKLDKKKKKLYSFILCLCVVLSILISFILNYKNYVVLYSGLDTTECYEIVQRLDELSIGYKVENESTIYVDKNDEPKVKMQLASEGYPQSSLNYDIFTKNIDFTTTDYEKTQYSLFQLQERLQASIETLDGVNEAVVTIALSDNSLAVLDEDKVDPTATAIINLKTGVTLSKNQISGIELLIARSVPGLTTENVTIVDQTGAALNADNDETLISTSEKIQTENEISDIISNRISTVLSPVYGKDNLSIGVNVVLDYSAKVTENTEYTPTQDNTGVITSYDQTYEGAGDAAGDVPGTNNTVPEYTTTTDTGTSSDISNDVSVDYVVNELKEQIQKQGAEISNLTVSILIDKADMSADEINKVIGIVANASGVSTDKVQLFNTEFTAANEQEALQQANQQEGNAINLSDFLSPKYLIIYAIIAFVIISGLVVLSVMRKTKRKKQKKIQEVVYEKKQEKIDIIPEVVEITESKEQQLKREIKDFSMKAPQITASLLRTLLKGDSK